MVYYSSLYFSMALVLGEWQFKLHKHNCFSSFITFVTVHHRFHLSLCRKPTKQ